MRRALACTALVLVAGLAGCLGNKAAYPNACEDAPFDSLQLEDEAHTVVAIRTAAGCMTAELYDDKAPITVANFLRYVEEGFYTDLQCYRIEPNFVNQCGGERAGKQPTHDPIKNEAGTSGLRNEKHTLAMARTSAPDSAQTEFFLNQADNCFLDHPSVSTCANRVVSPDGYAVFGRLVSGEDVSDRMNGMAANPPALESIKVVRAAQATDGTTEPGTTTPNATTPGGTTGDGTATHIVIRTGEGDMMAELFHDKAPNTVANFLRYVEEGFYTDLACYRIEPGFVNQCGGERAGKQPTHPPVQNEAASSGLRNEKYTLAMARTNDPHSARTEFFINAADNCFLDHPTVSTCASRVVSPDGYAVFGRLVGGLEVSDRMNQRGGESIPLHAIVVADPGTVLPPPPPAPPPPPPCPSGPVLAHQEHAGNVDLDLITPGTWTVCGDTEHMYLWVRNKGGSALDYTWSVTGPGGASLPTGWAVTFEQPGGQLKPGQGTEGSLGDDWAATVATLRIPADSPAGTVEAELHAGGAMRPFTFHVHSPRGTVAGPGARVTVGTVGTFADTGEEFWSGDFPTTLAAPGAVPGVSYGLIGGSLGETVALVVPPPFAYGYNNPPGSGYEQFNGRTLVFTMTFKQVS